LLADQATNGLTGCRAAEAGPVCPWIWTQDWLELLFAHWPIPVAALRPHVPPTLGIDTFDGTAWVSLVAFRLERIRHRWLPSPDFLTDSLELNFRTYVRYHGESGIYFLSIHASNPLLVGLARLATPLPYQSARMSYNRQSDSFHFDAHRPAADGKDRRFAADFRSLGQTSRAKPGSLDHWLVERYCLFVDGRRGRLLRTVVDHPPWEVQSVQAQVGANTMGDPFGMDLTTAPALAHFSMGVHAFIWPFADPDV
jgi:uncharacterized protein YqjF (DUF2071 family)